MTLPATPENITTITDQLTALVPVAQELVTGSDLTALAAASQSLADALTPAPVVVAASSSYGSPVE